MGSNAILGDSLTLCCELLSKSLKVIYAFKNNKLLKPLLNASSMPGPMPGLEVIVINCTAPTLSKLIACGKIDTDWLPF